MTIPMSPPAVIAPARSADARASLVETLRRDLIGPMPEDADLACELLPLPPSSWYLTGYLVSVFAPSKVKARDAEEEMDDGADGAGADDVAPPERTARRSILPSSCGLSLLLEPGTKTIEAEVSWGEYRREVHEQGLEDEEAISRKRRPSRRSSPASATPGAVSRGRRACESSCPKRASR